MSREPKIRISRPRMTPGTFAGVFAGVILASGLLHPTAIAQGARPLRPRGVSRIIGFAQRPAPRMAQNTVPQKPANHPAPPPARPQQAQPHASAPKAASAPADQHPSQQRPLPQVSASTTPLVSPNRPGQTQQHLADWMEGHRNLPLAEQQRALDNEPGFRSLKPEEQQQLHQRLTQLNNMAPEQRQKLLERTEAMERLAPVQRQQVRTAMAQLGSIPEERRHIVSRQFYQLRDMPPSQRQAYLNSPQYHSQFNDQERGAISGLLNVTPIYPPLQAQPGQPR